MLALQRHLQPLAFAPTCQLVQALASLQRWGAQPQQQPQTPQQQQQQQYQQQHLGPQQHQQYHHALLRAPRQWLHQRLLSRQSHPGHAPLLHSGVRCFSDAPAALSETPLTSQRAFHAPSGYELQIESMLIFDSCWKRFIDRYGQDFRVPREIVWLNGAPGAGKGVNTPHILKTRGLTKSITISGLLEGYPEARRLIDAGEMIPDAMVIDLLLEALLLDEPGVQDGDLGVVVDGCPRTAQQVDIVKLFYEKLLELHHQFDSTPLAVNFPRPSFKVVILYVDEETSIKRQLQRARVANVHNRRVLDAGAGHFYMERTTDTDIEKCRKRYGIFKAHYAATLRLQQHFPFTLIDSMGTLAETQEQITKELRYQSSLDLGAETYAMLRHLPLSRDVVLSARQELVMRLDGYVESDQRLFQEVIERIACDVLPVIRQGGLAGQAEYVTKSPLFSTSPVAIDMLVDVLTDRGFHVCYIREELPVPIKLNVQTGEIITKREPIHRFRMSFETKGVRDDFKAMEIASHIAESVSSGLPHSDVRISHSVVPDSPEDEEADGIVAAEEEGEQQQQQQELAAVGGRHSGRLQAQGGLAGFSGSKLVALVGVMVAVALAAAGWLEVRQLGTTVAVLQRS